MGGSVFFIAFVVIGGALLAIFASPVFLLPAVLLVLAIVFAAPLLALVGIQTGGRRTVDGVPTTREASYDPAGPPEERTI